MQNIILILFALFLTSGLYLILTELLNVPTYKATKAILSLGKRERKKARDSDAFIMELAVKLSKILPMDEYKKRKLTAILKSAEISMTPEVYAAQATVKAGLVFLGVIPCLLFSPILSPVFVIIGIAVYFAESTKAEKRITARRQDIEYELPRFVSTLVQELKASRDVLSILEHYQKNAGKSMRNELAITTSDMRTGNYEGALTRFEARVSSAMLSDIVRGLIGVLRGDDGVVFFQMLSHDLKQLELQRLKRLAMERPPKIRKFSFLLLGCMLLLYMGVMGYQILGAMSGMF
ncbi:MAG TPA: secretion protein F [Clostridia bacterium]|nr:secretion protein F [Clostridia bacterium]